jgi:CelD/BcsL family acetyltransferase involved in cellulose biosynthesis
VEREARPAPYVDLAALAGDDFETSLSGNSRSQIRRSRKLYSERSGPIALTSASTLEEALSWLRELARLHNARWEAKGMKGSFAHAAVLDFHERFIRRMWPLGSVDLVRVRAGDEDMGYLYNFLVEGKVLFFQSGFAYVDDARFKPGLLTHSFAIAHYLAKGMREYDFLAGDARYKRSLGKSLRTLYWSVVYRRNARNRVLLWIRRRIIDSRAARSA